MIPKCDGRANVGLVSEDKKGLVKDLDAFIDITHFSDLEITNPPWRDGSVSVRGFGGTIPISGPHEWTYSDGLMLVGDAAGFTSPLFEGGSHLALKSAVFAAQTAARAIESGDLSLRLLCLAHSFVACCCVLGLEFLHAPAHSIVASCDFQADPAKLGLAIGALHVHAA